jgi:hypothetical protein
MAVPHPPPPGKNYAESKAILDARYAAEDADRLGAQVGAKYGTVIGDAQASLDMMNGMIGGGLERRLRSSPAFLNELQLGLAAKLAAVPDLPTYADPKLAEIAQKGFERGFGASVADAKLKAAVVILAANTALALSGSVAITVEQAGATALRAALARLRGMPVFIPGAVDGLGGFSCLPKPPVAAGAAKISSTSRSSRVGGSSSPGGIGRTTGRMFAPVAQEVKPCVHVRCKASATRSDCRRRGAGELALLRMERKVPPLRMCVGSQAHAIEDAGTRILLTVPLVGTAM